MFPSVLSSTIYAAAAAGLICYTTPGLPEEGDIMAGIATGISSLQSGLETPDVALNLRKQGDSVVRGGAADIRTHSSSVVPAE
jgi:hypothetical protein